MREDLEQLKQRIPLLQYLQRRHWTGCRVAAHRVGFEYERRQRKHKPLHKWRELGGLHVQECKLRKGASLPRIGTAPACISLIPRYLSPERHR
jgi:hypothetical protein